MTTPQTPTTTPPANACALCAAPVRYPDGVHLRSGKEVHVACVQARRAARNG